MNQTKSKIQKLVYVLIAFKIIDTISGIIFITIQDQPLDISLFMNLLIFIIFAILLLYGYRWPLYFWAVACFISIMTMVAAFEVFGINPLINVIIITNTILVVSLTSIVFYLLLSPDIKAYYQALRGK